MARHFKTDSNQQGAGQGAGRAQGTPNTFNANSYTAQTQRAPQAQQNPYAQSAAQQNPYAQQASQQNAYIPQNQGYQTQNQGYQGHDYLSQGYQFQAAPKKRRSKAPIIIAIILVLILGVAGVGGFYAWKLYSSALTAKGYINNVISTASSITDVNTDDLAGTLGNLSSVVESVQSDAAAAKAEVSTPLWDNAAKLPYIGTDIASVQTAAGILDDFAQTTLPALKDAADTLTTAEFSQDGSLNLEPIITIEDDLKKADELLAGQVDQINAVPDSKIDQIQSALDKGRSKLSQLYDVVDQATGLVGTIPSLLGADGDRTYLLLAQTNAEIRTAGGLAGAVGSLSASNGSISLGDFHSDADFSIGAAADMVGSGEDTLWDGLGFGSYVHNVPCEADYPTLAKMLTAFWNQQSWGTDTTVDGVMSVDPVALGAMLDITGSVTLDDGRTLDSSNASDFLLNTVYLEVDESSQDTYFQFVAEQVFDNMFTDMDANKMVTLAKKMLSLAEDRHIYFWSFHEEDEEILRKAGLTHEVTYDETEPVLGLYYNEARASKIDYYARRTTTISKTSSNTYHVTMTLNNVLESLELEGLARYITGNTPSGAVQEDFVIMPPMGGTISNLTCSDGSTFSEVEAYSRTNYKTFLLVPIQGSVTVEFDVTCADGAADLVLDQTPQSVIDNGVTYDY